MYDNINYSLDGWELKEGTSYVVNYHSAFLKNGGYPNPRVVHQTDCYHARMLGSYPRFDRGMMEIIFDIEKAATKAEDRNFWPCGCVVEYVGAA